ncbi:hypothetical protein [Phaeobacter sp. S60]|uniref:hypothetical protein n=1 Tax=Phaeobacter sp. S60 TaxID=1569353 RepID=UPI0011124CC6
MERRGLSSLHAIFKAQHQMQSEFMVALAELLRLLGVDPPRSLDERHGLSNMSHLKLPNVR